MHRVDEVLIEANETLPLVKNRKELRELLAKRFNISPLTVEDYLVQRKFKTHFKSGKLVEFKLAERLNEPEIAWFLGWAVGDGSFSSDFSLRFELNEKDGIDLYENFCKLLNKQFKLTKRRRIININNHTYDFISASFTISGMGFGLRSKDKIIELIGKKKEKIPDFLFSASEDVKFAFLKGIFESDGSLSVANTYKGKKYIELIFYSPSFEFLSLLKQLFPFLSNVKIDKRSKKGFYRTTVRKQEVVKMLFHKFYDNTEWYLSSKKEKFSNLIGEIK